VRRAVGRGLLARHASRVPPRPARARGRVRAARRRAHARLVVGGDVAGAGRVGPAQEEGTALGAGRGGAVATLPAARLAGAIEPAAAHLAVRVVTREDAEEVAVEVDHLAEEDLLAVLARAPDAADVADRVAVAVRDAAEKAAEVVAHRAPPAAAEAVLAGAA